MRSYLRNSSTSRSYLLGRWLRRLADAGLAVVCCTGLAFGIDPNRTVMQYVRDSWGVDRGFPNETVTSIAQTPDGYLWIGTDKGLIRFDGLNFQKVEQPISGSFSIGAVQSLISDRQGNLWILLPTTKLVRYHDGTFEMVRGEAENGVTAIGTGAGHAILISSLATGTLTFNGIDFVNISSSLDLPAKTEASNQIATTSPSSTPAWSTGLKPHRLAGPASGVISIGSADNRGVWLGTEGGELFNLKEGRASLAGNLAGARISSILLTENSELWLGTSKGLLRWNGRELTRNGVPSALQHLEVLSLLRDRDANIWVGTNEALMRVSSASRNPRVSEIRASFGPVRALFEDREGNVWIGGVRGLQRLSDSLFVTYSLDGPRSQSAGAVYMDPEDRMWVAPIDGGLRWLEGEEQGSVTAAGLNHDTVYSIAGGEQNEVWLGRQRGGLTRLTYVQGSLTAKTYTQADGLAQDSVYAVYRSRNGTVWSGTLNGGVSALHDGRFTTYTTANGLASNTVSSIAEAADGTMWFGTPNGVSALSNDVWRSYSGRDGLSSPNVNCLLTDSTGVLWMGTANGLALLRAGKVQVPPNMPDSLHEPVFGIAEDRNGELWIATASHILQVSASRLTENLLQESDVREYTVSDGLQGKEGVKRFRSVIADAKGRVWFSTNRGLSVVNSPQSAGNSPPALVHIAGVSADGNSFDLGEPLHIPPAKARVTFRFVGLSLKNPERVRYRYRLDGVDPGWSEATVNREATYGNLRPGNYRFHVMACNSDGIWNGLEAAIGFNVQPTLLQAWWFRTVLLLCAGLVTLAIYRLRVYQLTRLLNLRFEERLAERTRISQELHDTLQQGFQGLILRFQAANQILLSNPSQAKQALEGALDRADQALSESRKAIQRILAGPFLDCDIERALGVLMNELASDSHFLEGKRPTTSIIVEGKSRNVNPWACEEICKIAREALRSAFAHANAQHIEAEILFSKKFLRVRFRDDGVGSDPTASGASAHASHWGLTGMKQRAERLRGRLTASTKPRLGTEVEVTIPASTAFEPAPSSIPCNKADEGARSDR
jgi:ligand-binding sensor domain-containing protein/signal transduction histidine kinase